MGSQMYMISRKYAREVLDTYTLAWTHLGKPFAADWTITKSGNRAMIYPMLGLEDGGTGSTDAGQIAFHRNCFMINYQPALYV
jgi:hypothetical protein